MGEGQYFATSPDVASDRTSVPLTLPDLSFSLVADRGVFSHSRVDPGTKLLLLEAGRSPLEPASVLDLGCGWGPIAVALAHRHPDAHVWAVDVNERALGLTAQNLASVGAAERSHVLAPDDVPNDVRFDYIASNPPIRVGKPALHALLESWLPRLNPGGVADLVVQKHLGSDSLSTWMETTHGWLVTRLKSRAGYRILRVDPNPAVTGPT